MRNSSLQPPVRNTFTLQRMSSSSYVEPGQHQLHEWSHDFNTFLRQGRLVALRTKEEVQNVFQTIDVYIATIPLKAASAVLKCVRNTLLSIGMLKSVQDCR